MKNLSNKRKYAIGVLISLFLCIFGGFLANLAQTDMGNVTKKILQFETDSGHTLSAEMLVPDTATEDNPAPAIVWAHGGNTNKERSDNFQIEWARRGFVVISFDLYGHGESEVLNDTEWFENGRGLYDTVLYATTIPYIDADRIAVSGHSRGGNTIHESILIDNESDTPLIKAVLYVGRDAVYRDNETASFGYFPGKTNTAQQAEKGGTGEYFNYYGNRDVGIIADLYDDYSFKETDEATGTMKPNPEYLSSNNAKSFLNFGITPDDTTADGVEGQWYEQEINEKTARRIIYTPFSTHGAAVFTPASCTDAVDFMTTVFDMPTELSNNSHIYPLKTIGTLMGFVGFFIFVTYMALLLTQYEPFTSAGSVENAVMRQANTHPAGKKWLWGCLIANTIFPIVSAIVLFYFKVDKVVNGIFMQSMPLFYGVWGTVNAAFVILTTVIWYQCYAKKQEISLDSIDMKTSLSRLGKTIAAALIVTGLAFVLLFFVHFVFKTDFRIWYWAIRPFNARRLAEALKYLPFFIVAYVTASVFINCLNYNTSFGKTPRRNIWFLSVLNILPPFILAALGYGYFFITGVNGFYGTNNQISDWMLIPLVPMFVTPFITRAIYKKTKNPYLGGLINAVVITIMTCVNAQIVFPT